MQTRETARRFTRELEIGLTEEELQQYGLYLAKQVQLEEQLLDKKKKVTADYNAQISDCRREQSRLADARDKGKELRPVECEERWVAGTMQVRRLDTGAVVDVRPATASEAQLDIDAALDEDDDYVDGPDPTVMTPPGGAPPQDHDGVDVTSSSGATVHVMPDADVTLDDSPKRKRGRAADSAATGAGAGVNGKPKRKR
jgi:hypothetical protein